uniref:Uncharacterized protein n=1 Tax=Panagrolaimus sp. JU765 TaxID=591449 RepID=A0AC34Q9N1_9BILA
MDYRDGLLGIAGDRKFIDALYVYQKSKEELKDISTNDSMIQEKTEYICCIYYLKALQHVFFKIHSLSDDETKAYYLDHIRWNRNTIDAELQYFKNIQHLQDMIRITEFEKDFKSIFEKNFQLTIEEESIVNRYVHVYKGIQRYNKNGQCRKKYEHALQHTGRLFINYVNILRTRGYTKELDRHNVTFESFQDEARDLITRLEDVDDNLKKSVQETFKLFKDYREFDDRCAKINYELIAKALKLIHSRAVAIQVAKGAAETQKSEIAICKMQSEQEKEMNCQNEQEILEGRNALRRLLNNHRIKLDNYIRCEELRKAREETERAIRERRLEKEKQEERKRQIASMSRQQLEMEESHLKDAAAAIQTEVEKAQNHMKQGHAEFRLYIQDVRKIREGKNALDRQLGNIAGKCEPIFQDDVMEDDDINDPDDSYIQDVRKIREGKNVLDQQLKMDDLQLYAEDMHNIDVGRIALRRRIEHVANNNKPDLEGM